MDAYTREFTLETAAAAELFRCLQDTAGDDANRRGGGMDALFVKGHAWVLLWQRLDMRRAPAAAAVGIAVALALSLAASAALDSYEESGLLKVRESGFAGIWTIPTSSWWSSLCRTWTNSENT